MDKMIQNHAIYDYEMANAIMVIKNPQDFYDQNNQMTEFGNVVYCKSSTDLLVKSDADKCIKLLKENLSEVPEKTILKTHITSTEDQRAGMLGLFSSMLFLGIMLSFVFILATVLIIYYKQLSEGYEDQKRFAIMKKVGLEDEQIKKSINSQMLTVFF